MSAVAIKAHLGLKCKDRSVYDLLDALVGLGILERVGLLSTAMYSNTPEADFFLDKNKPTYVGGLLEMFNTRLYGFWGNLQEGLRTGLAQNETKNGKNIFETLYANPDQLKEFIPAMSGVQMSAFMSFAQKFDFSKARSLVDIGGSGGLLSLLVAQQHPHMQCVTWDLPPVEPIANDIIHQYQLQDRVKAASGDFFKDRFPKADVVVMGYVLHNWNEDTKLMLIQKAYDALPEGGAFIVIEGMIDDERKKNLFGLMMSLNMLIETGGEGFDSTFAEFTQWTKAIGFRSTSFLHLAGPTSAAIAYK